MTENLSVLENKENKEMGDSKKIKYQQSANSLFHFMEKLEYLEMKLQSKCLVPRYVTEEAEHYKIPNLTQIAYPMICFSDINLHRILPHADEYGNFAISFSKDFSIKNSIQPITYINIESNYFKNFKKALLSSFSDNEHLDDLTFETISDSLIYTMSYMKRLTGTQKSKKNPDEKEDKNFHDEHEWRFIPDVSSTDMPYFVTNAIENNDLIENYNKTLESIDSVKISFDYEDIQYIFVNDEKSRKELIDKILSFHISDDEKYLTISKISVLSLLKGDI